MNQSRATLGSAPQVRGIDAEPDDGGLSDGRSVGTLGAAPEATAGGEILVVDPGIDDPAVLIRGRRPGIEVVHLAPGGRGLEQIASHLAGRREITTLHLLCHGEAGAIVLAGQRIDLPVLAMRPAALAGIATVFAPGAKVALYGCSVATGAAGLLFLDHLEDALGVEVAASAGPVGAAALGGRWTLRDRYGAAIETAFSALSRATYPALLARAGRRAATGRHLT